MTKVAILQSNYIPWIGYFDILSQSDVFVLYDEVQFTKNDWRNRNIIKTKDGLQWLTVPVRHTRLSQPISEVEVAHQLWRRKHVQAISLAYAKAPFFNTYKERIFAMYQGEERYLSRINRLFLEGVCEIFDIKTRLVDSYELHLSGDRNEKLVDACNKLGATTYLSGPSAKAYLDVELFRAQGLQVEWADYSHYQEYRQTFPPFEGGVSILDFVFNMGNGLKDYVSKVYGPDKS